MTLEDIKKEKAHKILEVAICFLETHGSIEEVSKETGISTSSVQRYLNDSSIIKLLGSEIYDEIQSILKQKRQERAEYAGFVSSEQNDYLKDENGKFIGSRAK